ncbi:MAG: response regulator [Planctomycetota bacterium]
MTQAKILVVDDEPYILRSMTYVLRREGFNVLEARNGQEALDRIRQENPVLIFLDVMMPRLSGYEVIEVLSQEGRLDHVHVVLLTAKGQESDRRKGLSLGAHEYMTKPFSPMRIVERAREILSTLAC